MNLSMKGFTMSNQLAVPATFARELEIFELKCRTSYKSGERGAASFRPFVVDSQDGSRTAIVTLKEGLRFRTRDPKHHTSWLDRGRDPSKWHDLSEGDHWGPGKLFAIYDVFDTPVALFSYDAHGQDHSFVVQKLDDLDSDTLRGFYVARGEAIKNGAMIDIISDRLVSEHPLIHPLREVAKTNRSLFGLSLPLVAAITNDEAEKFYRSGAAQRIFGEEISGDLASWDEHRHWLTERAIGAIFAYYSIGGRYEDCLTRIGFRDEQGQVIDLPLLVNTPALMTGDLDSVSDGMYSRLGYALKETRQVIRGLMGLEPTILSESSGLARD
jgi:hypothetical protein